MRKALLVLMSAGMVLTLAGCEALEYKNLRDGNWLIWSLCAFVTTVGVAAIARFAWKLFRGQPIRKPVTARWGSGGWIAWWFSWRWWGGGGWGGWGDGGGD